MVGQGATIFCVEVDGTSTCQLIRERTNDGIGAGTRNQTKREFPWPVAEGRGELSLGGEALHSMNL